MSKIRAITYSIGDRTYQRSIGYTIDVLIHGVQTRLTIDEIAEISTNDDVFYEIWIRNQENEKALWKRLKSDNIEVEYDNYNLLLN